MGIQRILRDLETKVIGLQPDSDTLREGFFVSFRSIGLPVREHDYRGGSEDFFIDGTGDLLAATEDITPNEVPDYSDGTAEPDAVRIEGKAPLSPEMNYLRTFVLSDHKIKMRSDFVVEEGASRVSDTWEAILKGAAIDITAIKENETVAKAFEELEKKITPEMIARMDEAEAIYNNALEALVEKYTESRFEGEPGRRKWMFLGKTYQRKAERYAKAYRIAAREYEGIMNILDAHGVDPAAFLISRAKTRYENWRIQLGTSGSVPYTFMSPSDWYSPYASGWTKYTEQHYKENVTVKNSTKGFDIKLGLSIGIWNIGPEEGYNSTKECLDTDTEDVNITFDYMVAKVNRPWMDTSLLHARNWYLKSDNEGVYPAGCISDGTFGQQINNTGHVFLPAVITRLILIKNLKITWEKKGEALNKISKTIDAGGTVGIGPFSIGGGYNSDKSTAEKSISDDGKSIIARGVQLIGYVSEILPESPHLDSK